MDLNHEQATSKLSSTKASARKTVWDSSTHMIFVELCLEEVKNGNRPASHFNKVGWTNLANNLKTRTGKDYLTHCIEVQVQFIQISTMLLMPGTQIPEAILLHIKEMMFVIIYRIFVEVKQLPNALRKD
ncbi:putative Myb/SANT-like domain-containing protein [Helianthus annuus]|nr:putative Myb/SANT-like domain-containing protein [Helianthus annuus]